MSTLRRILAALLAATALAALAVTAPATANATTSSPTTPMTTTSTSSTSTTTASASACTDVREIGTKAVVSDLGMSAFTVRQYIGWCSDTRGSAWMNYASVYVWEQYHARGTAYRASVGVAVAGEPETRGFLTGPVRQRLTYSTPVRTTSECTQGWGKLVRSGGESGQGLSSRVC